jgi:twitching motility protein PilT
MREVVVEAEDLDPVLLELIAKAQRDRLESEHEIDFAHVHKDASRFRASYSRTLTGLSAVFRHVPNRVLTLAELGCPEVLWRLADRRAGLILVTGPAGSGKSTTLSAMVDHINKTRACHILTIEDPIEVVHEPLRAQITQREVGLHASSVAAALRSAARENPDVVVVSELRTPETMKLALDLASYGVLVFATLSTNGAAAGIDRVIESFPIDQQLHVRALLAESLVGLISQQLFRASDGKRAAAHEILCGSAEVAAIIRAGDSGKLTNVMQAGHTQGMLTMDMALERLLGQSRIAAEDALDRAVDREAFSRTLARVRPDMAEKLG